MRLSFNTFIDSSLFHPKLITEIIQQEYSHLQILKFGEFERKMTLIKNANPNEVLELWNKDSHLLFKGKNKFFMTLALHRRSGRIVLGGGDFSIKEINSIADDLISLIHLLKKGGLIFGRLLTEDLHNEKHQVITHFDSGGRSTRWTGSSQKDFSDFLPGLGWYTFFGNHYVKSIGENNLLGIGEFEYLSTEDCIAVKLKTDLSNTTLSQIESIEDKIGSDYFFSKKRKLNSLQHPQKFRDYLELLKTQSNRKA